MQNPTTVGEAVLAVRESNSRIRRINAWGGRTAATHNALERHYSAAQWAEYLLLQNRHKELVGLLVEEDKLALRLAESRKAGQERPELELRLGAIRTDLRSYVKLNGGVELPALTARPLSRQSVVR